MLAYKLKIVLNDSKPLVWRRVAVPCEFTLIKLHDVLNHAMGWQNRYFFNFMFDEHPYNIGVAYGTSPNTDMPTTYSALLYLHTVHINDFFRVGSEFRYLYDYNNFWMHTVHIEELFDGYEYDHATILEGEGDCPPEDCGGARRYYERFASPADHDRPHSGEHKAEWREFSDEEAIAFDISSLNSDLAAEDYPTFLNTFVSSVRNRSGEDPELFDKLSDGLYDDDDEYFDDDFEEDYLVELLDYHTKHELIDIAKLHGLSGYSRFNKPELITFIADEITEPERVRMFLMNLDQDEMDILDSYINDDYDDFDDDDDAVLESRALNDIYLSWLSRGGYYYEFEHASILAIEFIDVYDSINSVEFKKEWRHFTLLSRYIRECVNLYGIVPVETLLNIINKQNKAKTDSYELYAVFAILSKRWDNIVFRDDSYYLAYLDLSGRRKENGEENDFDMLKDDLGIEFSFQSFDELLAMQGDIPFYIPKKEHIFNQNYIGYCKHPEFIETLFNMLLQDTNDKRHYIDVSAFITVSMFMIHIGASLNEIIALYNSKLSMWLGESANPAFIKKLHDLLRNIYENSRMISLRGHTPIEAGHLIGRASFNETADSETSESGSTKRTDNVISFKSHKAKKKKKK
ncbi:MAG: hypothetical protein LBL49_06525 [Clostridiales Family XIII bacterium]|jgi:hypothetical protein|nr:hypothetical protein [Clostridiales Family XIII bacterium]